MNKSKIMANFNRIQDNAKNAKSAQIIMEQLYSFCKKANLLNDMAKAESFYGVYSRKSAVKMEGDSLASSMPDGNGSQTDNAFTTVKELQQSNQEVLHNLKHLALMSGSVAYVMTKADNYKPVDLKEACNVVEATRENFEALLA